MYDANMQSKPLFTKPVDRQLLQAPDPSPLQDMNREEAAYPHLPDHKLQNGRKYVGQTVDVTARFNGHMAQLNRRMAADVACAKAANTQDFGIETLENTQIQGAVDHLEAMHIARLECCSSPEYNLLKSADTHNAHFRVFQDKGFSCKQK